MDTISISQLKINPSEAISKADDYPLVIKNRGVTKAYIVGKELFEKFISCMENYLDKRAIEETNFKREETSKKLPKTLIYEDHNFPKGRKELKKLSKIDQIAVTRKIRLLNEVNIPQEEKLKGYTNIFRVRVGNIRIVYRKTSQEIYLILIGHRKEIYKLLKQLF